MTVSKLLNIEIDFAINNHRKYCILITYIKIEQLKLNVDIVSNTSLHIIAIIIALIYFFWQFINNNKE